MSEPSGGSGIQHRRVGGLTTSASRRRSICGILGVEARIMNSSAGLAGRITAVLSARPEILEAYLFGSRARGADQAHSDIDIAVFIDDGKTESGSFGYRSELTSVLMSALGTNAVDVVVLNHAPPLLYHRVLRDGMRLYSRDLRATTVREGRALSRHCDFVPHLAKIDAILGGRSTTTTR
jgi:predicted nucleotidyltransferase